MSGAAVCSALLSPWALRLTMGCHVVPLHSHPLADGYRKWGICGGNASQGQVHTVHLLSSMKGMNLDLLSSHLTERSRKSKSNDVHTRFPTSLSLLFLEAQMRAI